MLPPIPRSAELAGRFACDAVGDSAIPAELQPGLTLQHTMHMQTSAHPTLCERYLCTKMPAAIEPSSSSTSTSMPTFSPAIGSMSFTHGIDSFASHLVLHSRTKPCAAS